MITYPKIQTVYKRDPATKYRTLLEGEFATPELEYLARNEWIFTEKIDGTNIRVGLDPDLGGPQFGGRTERADIPPFLLATLEEMFPEEALLEEFHDSQVVLFGEGYGARIQKGGGNYIPDSVSFILFDVWINGWWLRREAVEEVAQKLGIGVVPIVGKGTLYAAVDLVRDGFPSTIGTHTAEGLVMRPAVELLYRTGHPILAKIKHKDFPK